MSNHNYSQYSNKNKQNKPHNNQNVQKSKPSVVKETPVMATPKPTIVQETVETVSLPAIVDGTVSHCTKLNVREKPDVNSGIVYVLDVMSEIKIDVNKSTENWFYVYCATGAEGYCMKEYIEARV